MMSRSLGISPGTLAPASTTSASASSGAPRIVSGTPTRLLRFPVVACTRYEVASTARIISLVLVFPLDPVIATTGLPGASRRRRARARAPSAASVSGTWKKGSPSTGGVPRRTTAAAAPWACACARKSCASKRSPLRATNRASRGRCRVSVLTALKRKPEGPDTPRALATRAESQAITAPPRCHSAFRTPHSALGVSRRPQLSHHHPLIERLLRGADDLIGLVPFAGQQDRVGRLRQLEGQGDGAAAIHLAMVWLGPSPHHPGQNGRAAGRGD